MQLCHVTGTVVSTRKHNALRKGKLLIVKPVDTDGKLLESRDLLALDPGFDAGIGDRVLIAKEGQVVAQLLDANNPADAPTPANVVIIGVVDDWSK